MKTMHKDAQRAHSNCRAETTQTNRLRRHNKSGSSGLGGGVEGGGSSGDT